ncbi:programmed cell death 6-interacting protein-like isoform X2 [Scleropages formosus]|uniref:programmed cell death 6-interacting protein-like isoform X2 n=1 Tax=Scleropages formosus TaxID=113540 RepID=UPI0010FA8F17|nr:programmed cell death 6-interacting protein-like isoform X2 [Scleropages formosus]
MAAYASVPLKKSSEVDLAKALSKYVKNTYANHGDQDEYLRAVEELNKLRKSALGRPLDKHENSLEILYRYYDQLCAVEPKFPFSGNQLCLTFTWKDAFDKGTLFSGSAKLGLPSVGYEKTCVLFNVGALASQIAVEQRLDTDEGLKTAAKYYQVASGAFGHIKDTVLSALTCEPTVDISPDCAGALSLIMLAQAQEVVFLKATSDKMKDAIIARLATQAADFYGEAFKTCHYKDNLAKEVLPVLGAKHCLLQASAEYHQAAVAKQQKKFGEEIARLQLAAELLKTVKSRYEEYVNAKNLTDKVSRALTAAKKDNDFIYHDRVPETRDLERIGKAALVKPTAIQVPLSQKFTDIFQKMVPMAVQEALSSCSHRRAELINRLVGNMREATVLLNGVLASLNLPAALEDLSGDSVPQSILEKSRAVVQQGGLQSIERLIKELPELLQRNREILDESLKILDTEEQTDNELRANFTHRWQRTPSGELYKSLRAEGANYRGVLDQAVHADQVVRERYNAHCETIALLCKPEAELSAAIPSANPAKTLEGSEVVGVLRAQLAQLDQLKKEREQLENDIKSTQFDMTTKFLTALAQDGAINEEALSVTELDGVYGGYTQKVQQSLKTQEEVLDRVQTSHKEFSSMKQSNQQAVLREEVLKKLASAHDSYMEIFKNLHEGTKFYNDLTEILLKFQNKCSDIVFARKTEREELLKDIQESIANEPSAPAIPSTPSYHAAPAAAATPPTPATSAQGPAAPPPAAAGPAPGAPTPAPRTVFSVHKSQPPARPPPPPPVFSTQAAAPASTSTVTSSSTTQPSSNPLPQTGAEAAFAQAQGPPYPTYQGYPGFYAMPMPYFPYGYGQYNMPFVPFQNMGPTGFAGSGQPPQPQAYSPSQPQQPHYP